MSALYSLLITRHCLLNSGVILPRAAAATEGKCPCGARRSRL